MNKSKPLKSSILLMNSAACLAMSAGIYLTLGACGLSGIIAGVAGGCFFAMAKSQSRNILAGFGIHRIIDYFRILPALVISLIPAGALVSGPAVAVYLLDIHPAWSLLVIPIIGAAVMRHRRSDPVALLENA